MIIAASNTVTGVGPDASTRSTSRREARCAHQLIRPRRRERQDRGCAAAAAAAAVANAAARSRSSAAKSAHRLHRVTDRRPPRSGELIGEAGRIARSDGTTSIAIVAPWANHAVCLEFARDSAPGNRSRETRDQPRPDIHGATTATRVMRVRLRNPHRRCGDGAMRRCGALNDQSSPPAVELATAVS